MAVRNDQREGFAKLVEEFGLTRATELVRLITSEEFAQQLADDWGDTGWCEAYRIAVEYIGGARAFERLSRHLGVDHAKRIRTRYAEGC
ncbi:Hypothetical protein AJAP_28060 [Amycolatopsis japonica]|uniref:Uncharacterized protein n=1 Tax=Amycolatopsis japonica TaxID=208439 RepID=A0A075V1B1_9PSEU|nr:Hypothetical protein AJAP_28060 [Amycolatopsis japonica]